MLERKVLPPMLRNGYCCPCKAQQSADIKRPGYVCNHRNVVDAHFSHYGEPCSRSGAENLCMQCVLIFAT